MKILLAVDGSTFSDVAVDEVARRPWPSGGQVKVITAVELPVIPASDPWMASPYYFEEIEKAARENAQSVIEKALSALRKGDRELTITSDIIQGPARRVVLEESERWGADLIVVGSHGHSAWSRLLLGSVSNAIVNNAGCSVEVVRRRQNTGK
jgi:nucleotide-binding universal stress UspA family protein